MKSRTAMAILCAAIAVAASSALAPAASAAPAWRFEGAELTEPEKIAGLAVVGTVTIPGLTNTCKTTKYKMTISDSGGTGKGEVTSLSFDQCSTGTVCAIDSMDAEKLPWPVHLTKVLANNYVVIEGVKIGIFYGGVECALDETLVTVSGSAAGRYDNATETIRLDAASSASTKATLKAFGEKAEWSGVFTTEALGARAGQSLEVF